AIPFANIYFKGTTIGVTSGFNGEFSIETARATDTLIASYIGYLPVRIPVKTKGFQTVKFSLVRENIELSEVIIVPGENPAEVILKRIIRDKALNNQEEYARYNFEAYNKIEFDANNISDKFMDRRILRPFNFIFDYMDTSAINGKSYLPIFISETISRNYYRREPRSTKEVISANQVSGIKNASVSTFLGDIEQKINIYDNYLTIFQKNFVSPVANFGLMYYRYYLVDSTWVNGRWSYEIMFKPRRKQELTFVGSFWVDRETNAVARFDMRMVDDANMNFVNDLVLRQEFNLIEGRYWMKVREHMVADFNVVEDTRAILGFFGHKTTTYRDFRFDEAADDKVHASPVNIIVEKDALDKDEMFWDASRHDTLSADEQKIYHMIDTLSSLPVFNTYVDIIKMITTGYYINGNFEWGPYMSVVSFNTLEGIRFRLGGRTSNYFSKRIMFDAHLAYGTEDQEFKYGGGLLYMVNKNPRRTLSATYRYDIEQLGQSQSAFREDFLLAALLRRRPMDKLSKVQEMLGAYEHEWFNGFSNTLSFARRNIFAVGGTDFSFLTPEGEDMRRSLLTTEMGLQLRMAYKERFVMGEFERVSLGAMYPILDVRYAMGVKGLMGGEFNYHRLQVGVRHWFNVGAFGWSKYILEAGRIWGQLPYPLPKIHEGNETYSFDEYSFNMMNYYEFISDKYFSAYYTHHFLGLFLNRVPLMRKLKWREVGFVSAVVGGVDEKTLNFAGFPERV
ncbi:MAG: carboxypeptidase-like regulatory domain-containing protein, partial [Bacteroidales bacterium]|nr:carboxypeptidase-like regulatory domain-containing protein [Bacteroidales bacterium]